MAKKEKAVDEEKVKKVPVEKEAEAPTDYEAIIEGVVSKMTDEGEKISKSAVKKVMQHLPEVIAEVLEDRGEIRVKGLFTAKLTVRSARTGYNIIKQEKIEIPEKVGVNISAAKTLKDAAKNISVKDFNKKFSK